MAYVNEMLTDVFSRELEKAPIEPKEEFQKKPLPKFVVKVVNNSTSVPTKKVGVGYYETLCREQGLLGIARNPWKPTPSIFPERKKR